MNDTNAVTLPGGPFAKNFKAYKKQYIAFFMIVALFVFGQIAIGSFITVDQIFVTLKFATFISLLGLGQMLIIASGGDIDLSVGFTATIVAVLSAGVMNGSNDMLFFGVLIAIGVGGLIGLLNGLLTVYLKLPSLVVTLGMSFIIQGLLNAYTSEKAITGAPSPVLQEAAAKYHGVVPNICWILVVVAIAAIFLLNFTKIGTLIRGVGSNPVNARLSGVHVERVRILTFIVCGVIAGFVGLLLFGHMNQAFKDMGSSYVMPSIAAVVVGGVPLRGGETNFIGVILGAVVLQTLTNLFIAFGWGDAGRWLGYGLVLYFVLISYTRDKMSR